MMSVDGGIGYPPQIISSVVMMSVDGGIGYPPRLLVVLL